MVQASTQALSSSARSRAVFRSGGHGPSRSFRIQIDGVGRELTLGLVAVNSVDEQSISRIWTQRKNGSWNTK